MHEVGHHLLARAAFPRDEHRGVTARDPLDQAQDRRHGRTAEDGRLPPLERGEGAPQHGGALVKLLVFAGALKTRSRNPSVWKGLLRKWKAAVLDGVDRGVEGGSPQVRMMTWVSGQRC